MVMGPAVIPEIEDAGVAEVAEICETAESETLCMDTDVGVARSRARYPRLASGSRRYRANWRPSFAAVWLPGLS